MNVARIPLGSDRYALIDRSDAELVAGFRWMLLGNGYVAAWRGKTLFYLHRLIIGPAADELVDHVNQDPLDNRSCNLRIADKKLNGANRKPDRRRLGTSSRHKGVSWSKSRSCWRAYIHIDGKTRYLGSYQSEERAAEVYNQAAVQTWGEFARLNDVRGSASSAGDA